LRRLILFLHGLGGSSAASWGKFKELLEADDDLVGLEVAFLEQPSSPWRAWTSPVAAEIGTLAGALATDLEESFSQFDQILLVTHSMGGLVARKWLTRLLMKKITTNVAGIVFFAVPHEGSSLARVLVRLSVDHKQLQQLTPKSPFLTELNEAWVNLDCAGAMPIWNVAAARDGCVAPSSAAPLWIGGRSRTLAEKDHRSVIKPADAEDKAFKIVKNAALELAGADTPGVRQPRSVVGHGEDGAAEAVAGNPLFYYYRPEEAAHYLVRPVDGTLAQLLPLRHLWVHGPIGCGKTVAASRAMYNAFRAHLTVSLGASTGKGATGAIASLEQQVRAAVAPGPEVRAGEDDIDRIVSLLESCSVAGIGAILIEETPLPDEREAAGFFAAVRAISVRQAQRSPGVPVRLVFTSPVDPGPAFDGNDLASESVTVIPMHYWPAEELDDLLRRISRSLRLSLDNSVIERVLRSDPRSPRLVKMFIQNFVQLGGSVSDLDEALMVTLAGLAQ
jgi:pimeloyl-ACP methyl ester carboxylesterase